MIEREWDNEVGARRNILVSRWLPATLDDDFVDWIEDNLGSEVEKTLFPAFLKFLQGAMQRAREKAIPLETMPRQSKEAWCHNCDLSHEAQFFFLGLLYYAAYTFVFSPDDWKFRSEELGESIRKLYIDNRFASVELSKDRQSTHG